MPSPEELPDYERHGLFLVDRWGAHAPRVPHLAPRQMICLEFQQFVTPDDGRKLTELYNVQHLQSAQLDRVSRVCISTTQRPYSMLRCFFFWIETPIPQSQITRGDRRRFTRGQLMLTNVCCIGHNYA